MQAVAQAAPHDNHSSGLDAIETFKKRNMERNAKAVFRTEEPVAQLEVQDVEEEEEV